MWSPRCSRPHSVQTWGRMGGGGVNDFCAIHLTRVSRVAPAWKVRMCPRCRTPQSGKAGSGSGKGCKPLSLVGARGAQLTLLPPPHVLRIHALPPVLQLPRQQLVQLLGRRGKHRLLSCTAQLTWLVRMCVCVCVCSWGDACTA